MRCLTRATARSACSSWRGTRHAAEVVISDIFMPGQDGIQTLRQIRRDFPAVKVIVVSGGDSSGMLDLRRDAELLGAVKSLSKPFTAREIVEAVRSVLES